MSEKLYLECYSGISGDMMVAALLDLGANIHVLLKVLESLSVQEFDIKISRVLKSGIDACDFEVVLEADNHDHDMAYLYGFPHQEGEHSHLHEHHLGEEEHAQKHHLEGEEGHVQKHHHMHRGMKEITEIINGGDMTENARRLALRIFNILAEAEAKAHNKPIDEVHFHEVGAIDSIIDIISIAVCIDDLGLEEVIVPSLYEGKGTVRCQHGILPVPVPAVLNIVSSYGLRMQIMDRYGEYVTPTGAATVAALKTGETLPEHFVIRKIGIGAGKRIYDGPGILRAMIINEA